ncbi:MAG TPA: ATP-binding protein [Rhodocyclaceae bacterium]|nr:ATP-binding protein [Rhodocyclaceae bacterium]
MAKAPTTSRAPTGRLFWKFFFFFWAAQVLTSVGVGVTVWSLRPDHAERYPAFAERSGLPRQRGEFGPPRSEAAPGMLPRPLRPRLHPWRPPLMPLIAGSFVSLIFAALLAWYFARPIRTLRQAFNDVAAGRLATRIGASMGRRRDELADLGSEFDRMADRLQALIESQQRLLHDVSHELRSPLARLQAAVELIRQQPGRADELIARIERDSGRIDTLVGELLTLARLDAAGGRVGGGAEIVDLADLLSAIAEDAEFEVAGESGSPPRIEIAFAAPLPVRGDRELLHRALENVVRNAVRHRGDMPAAASPIEIAARLEAPPAGSAGTAGRQVVVDICDRGPGVPASQLEHIFEPFVRGVGGAATGGYGLGLAITRRVALAHGGSVAASNRAGGGLCVRLVFPAG